MSTTARALRLLTRIPMTRILTTLAAAVVICLATCWPAAADGPGSGPGAGSSRALVGLLVGSGALGGVALTGLYLTSRPPADPARRPERVGR